MSDEPIYTDAEADAILSRAAALQGVRSQTGRPELQLWSPSRLEAAAAEAGIDASFVTAASAEHQTRASACRRIKTAEGTAFERSLTVRITDEEWGEIVQAARDVCGDIGKVEWSLPEVERLWTQGRPPGDLSVSRSLSARFKGGSTVVRAEARYRSACQILFVMAIVLWMVLVSANRDSGWHLVVVTLAVSSGTVACSQLVTRATDRQTKKLLDKACALLTTPEPTSLASVFTDDGLWNLEHRTVLDP